MTETPPRSITIFGELDQPQNAARWIKERLPGVHHFSQKVPNTPVPDTSFTLVVTTDTGQDYEEVFVWLTTDEWQTVEKRAFTKNHLAWNSITWSYVQEWQITLPPQPEGVMLRYKIGAKVSGTGQMVYADNQSCSMDEATHYSIWFGAANHPDWAKQANVYQVFVDRFNPGGEKDWEQTTDLRKHFGGTLAGVIERLPYIKDLGFNAIWLTPIFDSPSHHGYDTTDYFRINPHFGTLDDFKHLVSEAHRLGIRVILDFVANHCSHQSPFFEDALKNQDSEYHNWFVWKQWPEYESFFNVGTMPKFDLSYGSPARKHLLEAAQYWLGFGVDGYRLDYASGPEHDFWMDFRRACVSTKPDVWTFGELVLPADIQASYGDALGGTLDFLLCQALRSTFGSQTWKLSKFTGFIASHYRYFGPEHSLPSFIDNHDMDRFYTITEDNILHLKLALLVLYLLPGPPIIYYGTEAPLSQRKLIHAGGGLGFDEARLEMDWRDDTTTEISVFLKKLAKIRFERSIHTKGFWNVVMVDDDEQVLVLSAEGENELLVINRSDQRKPITITLDQKQAKYLDLLNDEVFHSMDHRLTVSLSASSGVILGKT